MSAQPPPDAIDEEGFARLLKFITESRGIDFSVYKRASLLRRIGKRMEETGLATFDDYRDLLEISNDEFRVMFDTVLINVTSFFRDARAWEYLRTQALPDLVERSGSDPIRVWSAGCSTGEEPYSLAITFAELLGPEAFRERVKIYATDIDDDALRIARQGVYSAKAVEPVGPELVERYFEVTPAGYAFRGDFRRSVIYGRHDLTQDAPISRLDLLSCRNTLMYFNAETQSHILDRFNFALRDDGLLFLGKAELPLSEAARFEPLSMPHRLFRRIPGPHNYRTVVPPVVADAPRVSLGNLRQRQLRDFAIEVDALAHIIVDVDGTVAVLNNQARAMFGVTLRDEGRALRDLEISYRPVELRSLIELAQTERRVIRLTSIERRLSPDDVQFLDVQVQPLVSDDGVVLGVDVCFTDTTAMVRLQEQSKRISEDLETAFEELQSTNEELETTNEELQSSVEELETTNEELQSTNEELETTNEELQSSNEELETMNEELRARTAELDEASDYLSGVLFNVPVGVVVLDANLRVRNWNDHAAELWGLREHEVVGEAFFSLDFGLPTAALYEPVTACLRDRQMHRVEVSAVNRLGRALACTVTVASLGPAAEGVVVLMDERPRP